jgi:uncharacterized membrane protein YeaQ/YmgE (transglycosylase-associated protein family)
MIETLDRIAHDRQLVRRAMRRAEFTPAGVGARRMNTLAPHKQSRCCRCFGWVSHGVIGPGNVRLRTDPVPPLPSRSLLSGLHGRLATQKRGELLMNILIWLVVGGIIGWLASIFMKTDGQQGIFLNVVVGIVGALLAGWLITPLVGVGTINQSNFSLPALIVSFVGAVLLLALVGVLRRGSLR